jgi:hypothetical protein
MDETFQPHERERLWAGCQTWIVAQRVSISVAIPGEGTSSDEHVLVDPMAHVQRSLVDRDTCFCEPRSHVVDNFPT